jgi:hypothetical protein
MSRTTSFVVTLAASLGLSAVIGCGVQTPLAPKPTGGNSSGTAADGTTLKVGAPTLVSPVGDTTVNVQRPTLTISPAAGLFATAPSLSYEFELQNDAGTVITRATVSGTSYTLQADAGTNVAYRWRARAVSGGSVGPFSGLGRFLSPKITTPGVGSSDAEWKTWFLDLIVQRNAGPNVTIAGLQILEPDLTAAQVLIQRTSANTLRPRLYLPTGNPNNLYGRTVDLGDLDRPWQWLPRGSTTCEGAGCR